MPQRTRMGRWKMIAMLLICASPVIASYLTYYVIRPEGRRVYGELIQPQKDMPQTQCQKSAGPRGSTGQPQRAVVARDRGLGPVRRALSAKPVFPATAA